MDAPHRKPTRLHGYDYSNQNYYFVTICVHNKAPLFGGVNKLNSFGKIAETELLNIANHFKGVCVDKYFVMPNHIHAIIIIGCDDAGERRDRFPTLSTIVGLYKSGVSRRIHKLRPNIKIWQKSFYDHIIRDEQEYRKIWQYIEDNPLKCEIDDLFD